MIRKEAPKLSMVSMMISGLTYGGLKVFILFISTASWNIVRLIAYGADVNKPYSKFRHGIIENINNVYYRVCMWCWGYSRIPVIKKRI